MSEHDDKIKTISFKIVVACTRWLQDRAGPQMLKR
jgi:hypothetical protein